MYVWKPTPITETVSCLPPQRPFVIFALPSVIQQPPQQPSVGQQLLEEFGKAFLKAAIDELGRQSAVLLLAHEDCKRIAFLLHFFRLRSAGGFVNLPVSLKSKFSPLHVTRSRVRAIMSIPASPPMNRVMGEPESRW